MVPGAVMDVDTAPAAATAPPRSQPRSRHLWQVDVIRLLTFAAVISVHTLAFTQPASNQVVAGMMMLLQFGREVFFTISGFVLVYAAQGRPLRLRRFWPRRYLFVVVPYVTWSAVYYGYSILGPAHAPFSTATFGHDLLYGGAKYHLYFLLVTMQLYLAFPLIMKLVRTTAAVAGRVLVAVSVANLAWLGVVQWVPHPAGAGAWFWYHAYELLPTYSMYVLAGCYAAIHLDRLQRIVERHARALVGVAALCTAGALAAYAWQLPRMAPRNADAVLQPAMVLSCVAALIVLGLIGWRWAAGPRRRQPLIAALSDASFGVYLAHPLVLQLLIDHRLVNPDHLLPAPLATVVAFAITVTGGTLIALAARRTPLSLPLTGRPWRRADGSPDRALHTTIYQRAPIPA